MTIALPISDDEFSRANERAIAALRKMYPERTAGDIVRALRRSIGLSDPASHARVIDAALSLLEDD